MTATKLKIIESTNDQLNDKVLELVQISDMQYGCLKTKLIVIDTYNEIEQIKKEYEFDNGSMIFWDLHLTVQMKKALIFIDKISLLNE